MTQYAYIPTTPEELSERGWSQLDVILVSGDTYIDSPYCGMAVIGRVLIQAGFRVGIIAQPDTRSANDILRLGSPDLFWGVSGGCVDSMVANYTALKKRRRDDDFTPGGLNTQRPDRAIIAYSNLIRRYSKTPAPLVLGGIEASLRRIAHYDFWSNNVRRAVIFDAKADYLLFGMAEESVVALAHALQQNRNPRRIPGLCYISRNKPANYVSLPSFEQVCADPQGLMEMFTSFYRHQDPYHGQGLVQRHQDRYLVHNRPAAPLAAGMLDAVYELDYNRDVHPYYGRSGPVRALDTIRDSITTHRGCFGSCNFCAIAVHQGRRVVSRSQASILREASALAEGHQFKGHLQDVGGPTANMYGMGCQRDLSETKCKRPSCLFPKICPHLAHDHGSYLALLTTLRQSKNMQRVFIASGLRYDLILADAHTGDAFLEALAQHHVSGQLKVAPEHADPFVLKAMGKPGFDKLLEFKTLFDAKTRRWGKKQFLTYYFMAGHPGCTMDHMRSLKATVHKKLHTIPRQAQIFTPTPSTYSTLMYCCHRNPFTGKNIYVEQTPKQRQAQKNILLASRRKLDQR